MANFLERLLGGDPNKRLLKKLEPVVDRVNSYEPGLQQLSDDQLKAKTDEFKDSLSKGKSLDDILPEAFAVVRETARRVLKERPFDTQVMGGIVLHQGKISEMKTGEGKTLASTMPVYLNALAGKGVHVITVNDYLAQRDAEWMGQIYNFLGLTVGVIVHGKTTAERKEAYAADITYGTNNEFGFDYLRDNMAPRLENLVQRDLNFVIIDEVDSILIDEARTPLIISAPDEESADQYKQFARIVPSLTENVDYNIDEKLRTAILTDEGINKVESLLGIKDIYESGNITLAHHIEQSLRAHALYKKDKDYVVKDGQVVIVDEFTGRLMPGRRYGEGLHQAVEAKEGVEVRRESRTLATITFQNYFRLYEKIAGMTGTAKTEEEEFYKIYGLEVGVIPTNKPVVREDLNDLVYATERGKFEAVVREIKELHTKGQPVLVGTIAIEKSELLSDMLKTAGVPHSVLNAKHHEREAEIIKGAGQRGAVTIATNMAGRGTDIKLGEGVRELGGLFVLGTERHESRRIDNQLRGRSGRQGDPGTSRFYVSMEDDLMRLFSSERIKGVMKTLKIPEDQPLEHKMVSNSIEAAQKKVEGHNFDIRKHVLQYDDVMNRQRAVIYGQRRSILTKESLRNDIWQGITEDLAGLVNFHAAGDDPSRWNRKEILESTKALLDLDDDTEAEIHKSNDRDQIISAITDRARELYDAKVEEAGDEAWAQVERAVSLRVIDVLWVEHLDAMVRMREGIGLRGYAQKDPLSEYKQEAYTMFQRLLSAVQSDITKLMFKVRVEPRRVATQAIQTDLEEKKRLAYKGAQEPKGDFEDEKKEIAAKPEPAPELAKPEPETKPEPDASSAPTFTAPVAQLPPETPTNSSAVRDPSEKKEKVGRNDPCPCGSGKKYKKCHGAM